MTEFFKLESSESLLKDIEVWTERMSLLRGDNLYDLARLYFTTCGINTVQAKLKAGVPHGEEPQERSRELFDLIEHSVLAPAGLKFIRFIMGRLICTDDHIVGVVVNPKLTVNHCFFDVLGTSALVKYVSETFSEVHPFSEPPIISRISVDGQGALFTQKESVPTLPRVKHPELFYPYFDRTPAQIWEAFKNSSSNVLLLVGPPGTGKSNFITEMMHTNGWGQRINLADRQDVIQHRDLSDFIRGLPDGSVMITEDSDQLVMARKDGNENMAALLNATSGIASRAVKIVISTNLESVQRVDPALLRPGRCFDILEFQELSNAQAGAVREMMNLEPVDIEESNLTLAEVINYHERRGNRKVQQPFGFASAK